MSRSSGFTVIELVSVIVLLVVTGGLFISQRNDIDMTNRDRERKQTINALYYNLTKVYYVNNKYYPAQIEPATLSGIDPAILKDPSGVTLGENESSYRYEPTGCQNDRCSGFELKALLEKEADFVKKSSD